MDCFLATKVENGFQLSERLELSCIAVKVRRQLPDHYVCLGINEPKQASQVIAQRVEVKVCHGYCHLLTRVFQDKRVNAIEPAAAAGAASSTSVRRIFRQSDDRCRCPLPKVAL